METATMENIVTERTGTGLAEQLERDERRTDGRGGREVTAFRLTSNRRSSRKRLTIYLPTELLERMRNAVYWTPRLTLAGLIEQAVCDALQRMEEANAGAFPHRLAELKGGRPKGRRNERAGSSRMDSVRETPIAK